MRPPSRLLAFARMEVLLGPPMPPMRLLQAVSPPAAFTEAGTHSACRHIADRQEPLVTVEDIVAPRPSNSLRASLPCSTRGAVFESMSHMGKE